MENEAARQGDSWREYHAKENERIEAEYRRQRVKVSIRNRWRLHRRGWQPNWRDVLVFPQWR